MSKSSKEENFLANFAPLDIADAQLDVQREVEAGRVADSPEGRHLALVAFLCIKRSFTDAFSGFPGKVSAERARSASSDNGARRAL